MFVHTKNVIYRVSELIPIEFFDVGKVMDFGAEKHGPHNWLNTNGSKSSFEEMHNSMFHHLSESYSQSSDTRGDKETNLDPLLHLAARALMLYTRLQRGIAHERDKAGIQIKSGSNQEEN